MPGVEITGSPVFFVRSPRGFYVRATENTNEDAKHDTLFLCDRRYAMFATRKTRRRCIHRSMRSTEWRPGGNRRRFPGEWSTTRWTWRSSWDRWALDVVKAIFQTVSYTLSNIVSVCLKYFNIFMEHFAMNFVRGFLLTLLFSLYSNLYVLQTKTSTFVHWIK